MINEFMQGIAPYLNILGALIGLAMIAGLTKLIFWIWDR
jgi:hypothetical protein